MSDKTKNVIIFVEAAAVIVLSVILLFQIFPQTMREIAEAIGVFALIVLFVGLPLWANDDTNKRNPDTY